MNIFVLCTGRCGSVTFAKACSHLTNYSSGHESRCRVIGDGRLQYPQNHIEVDNRLAWFLGSLDKRYGVAAFYVHLLRDREAVAQSYAKRWPLLHSVVRAFGHGIVPCNGRPESDPVEISRFMVSEVNANIEAFLKDKPHQMTIRLETVRNQFPEFLRRINATGDLEQALTTWNTVHNASA